MSITVKVTHDGPRNAAIQITGSGYVPWTVVADVANLRPVPKYLVVDAVHYALSDGLQCQFAWDSPEGREPFLPIAGRGKLDFSEVKGLRNTALTPSGSIEFTTLGDPNGAQIFTLVLDLSKHMGEN